MHELDSRKLAANAQRLIRNEPVARRILVSGMPPSPPAPICTYHNDLSEGQLSEVDQSVLRDRALMPMCLDCCREHFQELHIDPDGVLPAVDTCVCAAEIFSDGKCFWCALERTNGRKHAYEMQHSLGFPEHIPALNCKCDQVALPIVGQLDLFTISMEIMRECAACAGVVTAPCFALDGKTPLALPIGLPSELVPFDVLNELDEIAGPSVALRQIQDMLFEREST